MVWVAADARAEATTAVRVAVVVRHGRSKVMRPTFADFGRRPSPDFYALGFVGASRTEATQRAGSSP